MGTHTHMDQSKVVQAKVQVLVDLKARCLFEHLPFREMQTLTRWFVARKSTANYPYDRGTGVKTYLGVAQIGNTLFAKDYLLTGQEQACSRIRILVVCLVVLVSPCRKWPYTQGNDCCLPHSDLITPIGDTLSQTTPRIRINCSTQSFV